MALAPRADSQTLLCSRVNMGSSRLLNKAAFREGVAQKSRSRLGRDGSRGCRGRVGSSERVLLSLLPYARAGSAMSRRNRTRL